MKKRVNEGGGEEEGVKEGSGKEEGEDREEKEEIGSRRKKIKRTVASFIPSNQKV